MRKRPQHWEAGRRTGAADGCGGRRAAAGAILRKIPFSHPIPADSAENQGRHDSAGCGNTIFSVTAPGCLNVRFLHCNYFTRRTSVIYTRRSFRPFHRCTAVIAWKPNQQLSHFLPSISKTYTICLTDQVRKSNFLQNRTIRDNRNRLIGIFFHFRTPGDRVSGAKQAIGANSAPSPYSIQKYHIQLPRPDP